MTPAEVLELVRGMVQANRYMVTSHARQRMAARGITQADLRHGLTTATDAAAQPNGRWLLQTADLDGDAFDVVVEVMPGVVVVTVY